MFNKVEGWWLKTSCSVSQWETGLNILTDIPVYCYSLLYVLSLDFEEDQHMRTV